MTEPISRIAGYVQDLYNQYGDTRQVYHNFHLAYRLFEKVKELANLNGLKEPGTFEVLETSAWFYFTGYLTDNKNPQEGSLRETRTFLEKAEWPAEKTGRVLLCLKSAWGSKPPENIEEQCFTDAVTAVLFGDKFGEDGDLARLELELTEGQHFSDNDWIQYRLQQLLKVKFLTAPAKVSEEPYVAKNILFLKERLEKGGKKEIKTPAKTGNFQNFNARTVQRAVQTFFRVNYRNHIQLSAIADNKAHIMISVNAILISVIISLLSYRNLTEANPVILMPAIVFLITGLTSLIFAVLSARPKVTSLIDKDTSEEEVKKNIIFFGNFASLDVDDFETSMDEVFRDGGLLIGNMTRDLYYLGKVLHKKYRYLTIAYNVFMVGFVATVLIFFIVFLR